MQLRIRWGLVEGGRPTSELPTHLMNHEVKKKLTNGKHRVIYHAHHKYDCTDICTPTG